MDGLTDRVVCLLQPGMFGGVGGWYQDFRQTSDAEVKSLLDAVEPGFSPTAALVRQSDE
jgi:predicted phosphoribosyltransferase